MIISRNMILWGLGFSFLLSVPFMAGGMLVWYGRSDNVVLSHRLIRQVIVTDEMVIFDVSYHARNAKNRPVTAQVETAIGQGEITGFLKSGGNKALKFYKKQASVIHLEPLEEKDISTQLKVPVQIYAEQLSTDRDVVPQVRVVETDNFDDLNEAISELPGIEAEAS
ncbi:MAG: hypothetical protein Q8R76_09710 [Candidatus Omnitrophota bacterium]|nr:hypothetical protein [Candidatus Omnitrophota bacterium]